MTTTKKGTRTSKATANRERVAKLQKEEPKKLKPDFAKGESIEDRFTIQCKPYTDSITDRIEEGGKELLGLYIDVGAQAESIKDLCDANTGSCMVRVRGKNRNILTFTGFLDYVCDKGTLPFGINFYTNCLKIYQNKEYFEGLEVKQFAAKGAEDFAKFVKFVNSQEGLTLDENGATRSAQLKDVLDSFNETIELKKEERKRKAAERKREKVEGENGKEWNINYGNVPVEDMIFFTLIHCLRKMCTIKLSDSQLLKIKEEFNLMANHNPIISSDIKEFSTEEIQDAEIVNDDNIKTVVKQLEKALIK